MRSTAALVGDAGQLGGEPVFERREVRCEVRHSERRCWTKQNARSFDQAFLRGIMRFLVWWLPRGYPALEAAVGFSRR
jgi:hypothetical protein